MLRAVERPVGRPVEEGPLVDVGTALEADDGVGGRDLEVVDVRSLPEANRDGPRLEAPLGDVDPFALGHLHPRLDRLPRLRPIGELARDEVDGARLDGPVERAEPDGQGVLENHVLGEQDARRALTFRSEVTEGPEQSPVAANREKRARRTAPLLTARRQLQGREAVARDERARHLAIGVDAGLKRQDRVELQHLDAVVVMGTVGLDQELGVEALLDGDEGQLAIAGLAVAVLGGREAGDLRLAIVPEAVVEGGGLRVGADLERGRRWGRLLEAAGQSRATGEDEEGVDRTAHGGAVWVFHALCALKDPCPRPKKTRCGRASSSRATPSAV